MVNPANQWLSTNGSTCTRPSLRNSTVLRRLVMFSPHYALRKVASSTSTVLPRVIPSSVLSDSSRPSADISSQILNDLKAGPISPWSYNFILAHGTLCFLNFLTSPLVFKWGSFVDFKIHGDFNCVNKPVEVKFSS